MMHSRCFLFSAVLAFFTTAAWAGPYTTLKDQIVQPIPLVYFEITFDGINTTGQLAFRTLDENTGAFTAEYAASGDSHTTPVTGQFNSAIFGTYTFNFDLPLPSQPARQHNFVQPAIIGRFSGALRVNGTRNKEMFMAGTVSETRGYLQVGTRPFSALDSRVEAVAP